MAVDISVVVPVYNVEEYLAECLDSILAQSHKNLEIVLVNDGSTDGSLDIMNDYAARDDRVKVIDKPNGGYGSAVNRGIDEAHGEYIAVVEPDDFIDPYMYEDLLAASRLESGQKADVIKASYWNYYDANTDYEGQTSYIEVPNLTACMPKERMVFTVFKKPEVLKHHPSIWSAIYKRNFLDDKKIRMLEPKGAGWVDNPFFYETLCQAEQIVWIPNAYYYYRQTNPNASSHIKDYNLPFDRLRDIREIMKRLEINDVGVLSTLYKRSFNYIRTTYETFGFPETDPGLQKLVREVMDSFDKDIMRNTVGPWTIFGQYYRDINGSFVAEIPQRESSQNPRVSIIAAIDQKRPYLYEFFLSMMEQKNPDFEVICVVRGERDRSAEVVQGVASRDKRFKYVPAEDGVNPYVTGIAEANSPIIYFIDPRSHYEPSFVDALVERDGIFNEHGVGILTNSVSVYDQNRGNTELSVEVAGHEGDLSHSMHGKIYGAVLTRAFLDACPELFFEDGTEDAPEAVLRILSQANSVYAMKTTNIKDQRYRPAPSSHVIKDDETVESKYGFDAYLRLRDYAQSQGSPEAMQMYRTILLMKVAGDVRTCQNPLTLKQYLQYLEDSGLLASLELDAHSPMYYADPTAYREMQKLLHDGLDNYVLKGYERLKKRHVSMQERLEEATAKIGKVKRLFNSRPGRIAKKVMPDKLWRKIGGAF